MKEEVIPFLNKNAALQRKKGKNGRKGRMGFLPFFLSFQR
jgi:hypothetical protein